jgi:hypothetical protein
MPAVISIAATAASIANPVLDIFASIVIFKECSHRQADALLIRIKMDKTSSLLQ